VTLLVDLFGYLSIVIHGLTIIAQSVMLGSLLFLLVLLRPLAGQLGPAGDQLRRDTVRLSVGAAIGLAAAETAGLGLQGSVLMATVGLSPADIAGASFAMAAGVKIAAALALAVLLATRRAPALVLLALGAAELAAATAATHAAARLDDRAPLLAVEWLHQFGAAIWIGGIPAFLVALRRLRDRPALALVAAEFSRMAMVGVAAILLSGIGMAGLYVLGPDVQWSGFYGTAYGVMVGAKIAMFAGLLALGYGNFRTVARLRRDPAAPVIRMRRFAEVEIGIGFSLFFAAASLTSVPPAVDLVQDRVSFPEIVARNRPIWPRLSSPAHDALYLPALQQALDAKAAAEQAKPPPAFVPGAGEIAPRNAADIAWSEYNHHWAGLFVLAIGVLALLSRAGLRWARHWPVLFLGLAGFLAVRSDPEVWPLGRIGVVESLRDVEVLQHRFFVLLTLGFAAVEWRVRAFGAARDWTALIFPLATAIGGAALLTHTHAIANLKDQLLIELTHTPLALLGIAAGWARWLELRLPGREGRLAGWVWPACFMLVALLLLDYREA
jgi:putative copper resistance protein D